MFFEKEGYRLLSQGYINIRSNLDYECSSGHQNQMSYTNFQQGYRCPDCAGNKRLTIERVRLAFEKERYQLLSNEYINCNSRLNYKCSKDHKNQTDWFHFQQGHRCPECWEWKNEKKLGEILKKIFPNRVRRQSNLGFLNKQKVDYAILDSRLAFEYDGECHFKPIQYGGMDMAQAEQCFVDQQERDQRKNQLCNENRYCLVRIAYNEDLTLENVKTKINKVLGVKCSL
jgi:very-short-patch-repair endonuclease